ncbi:MAG: glycosyltransferase [Tabrizicola sp.]|nr:glycosyltransferase [Tabrizicola sp.]
MKPEATVIVPTFDDWDRLQICLDCLAGQTHPTDLFEVIVANNNPSPEVPPSLSLPANTRVIHVTSPGSYAARNAALQDAQADVLFFTDSDCLPDPNWIRHGLAAIATLGPYGRIAGDVQLFPQGDDWTGAELYDRVFWMRQQFYTSLGWCVTANLVARRAVFDMAGPFSNDRFSGGDREWNLRASKLGSEIVFSSDTIVRHPARGSFAELAKKCRRLAGGQHYDEVRGLRRPRKLVSYLSFVTPWELRHLTSITYLTDAQRMEVLKVAFRLGVIELVEIVRLRYFTGRPTRS